MSNTLRTTLAVVLSCLLAVPFAALPSAEAGPLYPSATDLPGEPLVTSPVHGSIGPSASDARVYSIELAPGDVLRLELDADIVDGDLDLFLYDPTTTSLSQMVPRIAVSDSPDSYPESISYLVPPDGGGTYYVVVRVFQPLLAAMDFTLSWDTPALPVAHRMYGADRYATSLAISRSTYATSTVAILATGVTYPDALSASALAGALDVPLLLVRNDVHSSAFENMVRELDRLGVTDVYLVGGQAVLSSHLAFTLADSLGFSVKRLGGDDRYKTSRLVADEVARVVDADGGSIDAAFLVRGDDFADALASGPYAFSQVMPVLLTPPAALNSQAAAFVESHDITDITVVGGQAAVSAAVVDAAKALNAGTTAVVRVDGVDRYATAANLAHYASVDRAWATWDYVGVATGRSFPDALSGSVAAGRRGGVLLLTAPTALPSAAVTAMQTNIFDIRMALVFGGPAVILGDVIGQIEALFP